MNAPIPQPCVPANLPGEAPVPHPREKEPSLPANPAIAGCIASAAAPASQDTIRNPPSLPGEVLVEARKGASQSEIRNLLEACLRMLKLTGGSQYWTGDTQAALEFMEAAVAEALERAASRPARSGTSGVAPEIVGAVAASVDGGLQMAGIQTER